MLDRTKITEDGYKRVNNILSQFGDPTIEKSISPEEFNKQYGVGYEVFSKGNINTFIGDATKDYKEGEVPETVVKGLEDELKTLSQVLVKSDQGIEAFYVREAKEETTEETTSEETVEKGETTEEKSEETIENTTEENDDSVEKGMKDGDVSYKKKGDKFEKYVMKSGKLEKADDKMYKKDGDDYVEDKEDDKGGDDKK